jgi:branched-chain amino acid transport system ATP-binding protein
MLEIKRLTKRFGGLIAINDVDMSVKRDEILGIIGPNGAGKTTLFNLITGFLHATKGKLIFEGRDITNKSPHHIAKLGIVRTFQGDNVFPEFTVTENISLACHINSNINLFGTVLRTCDNFRKEKTVQRNCEEILDLIGLSSLANVKAKSLVHKYKRLLGIAIAMAASPKLLLLDEPLGGMNPAEVNETLTVIDKIWKQGTTILLIEHNMRATMRLCQRIIVINFGKKIAEGSPVEVKKNDEVIQAYIGAHQDVT